MDGHAYMKNQFVSFDMTGLLLDIPLFSFQSWMLRRVCAKLLTEPIPYDLSEKLIFKLATSSGLRMMVLVMICIQLAVGVTDLLLLREGYDYHLIFFAVSLNLGVFFLLEFIIKVMSDY